MSDKTTKQDSTEATSPRPGAAQGGRSPTEAEPGRKRRTRPSRWSAKRKRQVVLRLLRGESLDLVARETGVPASRLSEWRDAFLDGGLQALKSRTGDAAFEALEREKRKLQRKLGEVTMDNELLWERIRRLENGNPPARKRSKR